MRRKLDVLAAVNVLASAAQEARATMGVGCWDGDLGLGALVDALEALQEDHAEALEVAAQTAEELVELEFSADADLLERARRELGLAGGGPPR